jgi:hypothetical protein
MQSPLTVDTINIYSTSHATQYHQPQKLFFLSLSQIQIMASCLLFLTVFLGILAPFSNAAKALFVFGDSLVDSGNNNYLATTARADAPPYGIDSANHRASGRFSNGKNTPDILS